MNLLQIKRAKYAFMLCIIFGCSLQTQSVHAENMQEIIALLSEEDTIDAHDITKQYLTIIEHITTLLREFAHDLQNNKKIGYYLKELNKLVKELGEKAKNHLN